MFILNVDVSHVCIAMFAMFSYLFRYSFVYVFLSFSFLAWTVMRYIMNDSDVSC